MHSLISTNNSVIRKRVELREYRERNTAALWSNRRDLFVIVLRWRVSSDVGVQDLICRGSSQSLSTPLEDRLQLWYVQMLKISSLQFQQLQTRISQLQTRISQLKNYIFCCLIFYSYCAKSVKRLLEPCSSQLIFYEFQFSSHTKLLIRKLSEINLVNRFHNEFGKKFTDTQLKLEYQPFFNAY